MADIIAPIKKPNYLIPRQLGYHLRPVAFRPCLPAGLALSLVYKNLIFNLNYIRRNDKQSRATMWWLLDLPDKKLAIRPPTLHFHDFIEM